MLSFIRNATSLPFERTKMNYKTSLIFLIMIVGFIFLILSRSWGWLVIGGVIWMLIATPIIKRILDTKAVP